MVRARWLPASLLLTVAMAPGRAAACAPAPDPLDSATPTGATLLASIQALCPLATGLDVEASALRLVEATVRLEDESEERGPGGPSWLASHRPLLLHRLGEAQSQLATEVGLLEQSRVNDAFDACRRTPGCDTASIDQSHPRERAWTQLAVETWSLEARDYPSYVGDDQVLYALARGRMSLGELDAAIQTLDHLAQEHPYSPRAPEGWLLLASEQHQRGEVYAALLGYLKALSYPELDQLAEQSPAVNAAICYQQLGEPEQGIALLRPMLQRAMRAHTPTDAEPYPLEGVFGQLAVLYAEAGEEYDAVRFLASFDNRRLEHDLTLRLADEAARRGRYAESLPLYHRVLAQDETAADRPLIRERLIGALRKLDDRAEVVRALSTLQLELRTGGAWSRAQAAGEASLARSEARRLALETAVEWHTAARALRAERRPEAGPMFNDAKRAYELALDDVDPATQRAWHNLGELLYETEGDPRRALEAWRRAVALDPAVRDPEGLTFDSARGAVYAAHRWMTANRSDARDNGLRTAAFSPSETAFVQAVDEYRRLFPHRAEELSKWLFTSADLLLDHGRLAEASGIYLEIIDFAPDSRAAATAADTILAGLESRKEWALAAKLALAFYAHPTFGTRQEKASMYRYWTSAEFKVREEACTTSAPDVCARSFLDYCDQFPGSQVRDRALNFAGARFFAAGDLPNAIKARTRLVEEFPESAFREDAMVRLGRHLEDVGRFESAADWYEKAAREWPKNQDAQLNLYAAGQIRAALGDPDASILDYLAFVSASRPSPDRSGAAMAAAEGLAQQGATRDAAELYQAIFTDPAGYGADGATLMEARARYARLLPALGMDPTQHVTQSLLVWRKMRGSLNRADPAGELTYWKGGALYDTFLTLGLQGAGDPSLSTEQALVIATRELNAKVQALRDLENNTAEVIATASPDWGMAALVRMGDAYQAMGEAVAAAGIPANLSPEQREIQRLQLEDLAYAQRLRAQSAYAQTLQISALRVTYNAASEQAARKLGELDPAQRRFELLLAPTFLSGATPALPDLDAD